MPKLVRDGLSMDRLPVIPYKVATPCHVTNRSFVQDGFIHGVPMAVLLIGGAGYVGSHMIKRLLAEGERFAVLDNLSTGYRDAILGGEFIQGNCGYSSLLRESFRKYDIDTVMHFASFIQVGESVTDPLKYYLNNVSNTLQLLNTMVECGVKNFVF